VHMAFKKELKEECGVFGIASHPEASRIAYLGLYGLQHRGQESAGIATSDGKNLHLYKGMGYVADVFDQSRLEKLNGDSAIGHVRYSTAGDSSFANAQPIIADTWRGSIALAHNGNILNAAHLRHEMEWDGAIFNSTSDSEVVLHLISRSKRRNFMEALVDALQIVRGAYSLLILTPEFLIAARDPYGFRPLCLGSLKGKYVIASETCALDLIEAEYVREIEPGEIVRIQGDSIESDMPLPKRKPAHCVFEHVYFSRPDSLVFGRSVSETRRLLGMKLARQHPVDADIVVPVPDSGLVAALGYSQESRIPLEFGLIRNHYVGRTFIEPKQSIRNFGVKVKLNPDREIVRGKRVVLVDDSIVRGTTCRKIVHIIRSAGASEIHMRITSPPIIAPCYYGIDTPTKRELIAANKSVDEIRKYIGADSLGYLSIENLMESVEDKNCYCSACFTDRYPTEVIHEEKQKELFGKNNEVKPPGSSDK
jgi:amidophosphoribosyltransferase